MTNREQREGIEEINECLLTITDGLKLCDNISSLYFNQKYTDVTFIIDGQKIHAHKVVLAARSKYFDSLFCTEGQQSEITLTDVSTKVFQKVLEYIYTGSMTITSSDVESMLDVLGLANKYVLKNLESDIVKKISSVINMKNVCLFLNQANSHDMNEIRDACHSFADENPSEILTSDCLNNLTQKSIIKLLERDTFIALEIDIFRSVAKWCTINDDVDLVEKCVRLSSLSEEEILQVVRPSKLVEDVTLLNILSEISEGKPRTPQRGLLLKEENLATPEHKARVTSGTNTSFLLTNRSSAQESADKCASHFIGSKSGITVRLGVLSHFNHIRMKLWGDDERCYSYYIEVSLDGIKWQKVIDYSLYRCRSYQSLYFDEKIAQYIRVVGAHCTTNEEFGLVSFETYLKTIVPKVLNEIVCPTENVATEDKGAALVEGGYSCFGSSLKHLYNEIGKDSIIVQLAQPYLISYVKLQLSPPEETFGYFIETSINKSDWEIAVDRRDEDCRSEQILHFNGRPVVYVKITGTKSRFWWFRCFFLECYYSDCN